MWRQFLSGADDSNGTAMLSALDGGVVDSRVASGQTRWLDRPLQDFAAQPYRARFVDAVDVVVPFHGPVGT